MKPNEIQIEPGPPNHIERHPRPKLRDQLITAARLFVIAAALFFALWLVDGMVSS